MLTLNVNDHTEKKNGLTYLSWAWAWAEVLKIDPTATWEAMDFLMPAPSGTMMQSVPCMFLPNGTAMVRVAVTIKGIRRLCMLPVMDHRNKAIKDPDAFAVNTAIMRCMTKAISMHGLGLYIYAGEDLPEGEEAEPAPPPAPKHRPTQGSIAIAPDRMAIVSDTADAIKEAFSRDSIIDAYGYAIDLTDAEEKTALWGLLPSNIRSAIKKHADSLKEKP